MTPQEEIVYLTDLLLQASRWQVSEGEELDPLHLEVKDRLARLTNQPSVNVEGIASDKISKNRPSRSDSVHFKNKAGKQIWAPRSEVVKVVRNGMGQPWCWRLKSELTDKDVLYEEPT